jgi:hypothetical protein
MNTEQRELGRLAKALGKRGYIKQAQTVLGLYKQAAQSVGPNNALKALIRGVISTEDSRWAKDMNFYGTPSDHTDDGDQLREVGAAIYAAYTSYDDVDPDNHTNKLSYGDKTASQKAKTLKLGLQAIASVTEETTGTDDLFGKFTGIDKDVARHRGNLESWQRNTPVFWTVAALRNQALYDAWMQEHTDSLTGQETTIEEERVAEEEQTKSDETYEDIGHGQPKKEDQWWKPTLEEDGSRLLYWKRRCYETAGDRTTPVMWCLEYFRLPKGSRKGPKSRRDFSAVPGYPKKNEPIFPKSASVNDIFRKYAQAVADPTTGNAPEGDDQGVAPAIPTAPAVEETKKKKKKKKKYTGPSMEQLSGGKVTSSNANDFRAWVNKEHPGIAKDLKQNGSNKTLDTTGHHNNWYIRQAWKLVQKTDNKYGGEGKGLVDAGDIKESSPGANIQADTGTLKAYLLHEKPLKHRDAAMARFSGYTPSELNALTDEAEKQKRADAVVNDAPIAAKLLTAYRKDVTEDEGLGFKMRRLSGERASAATAAKDAEAKKKQQQGQQAKVTDYWQTAQTLDPGVVLVHKKTGESFYVGVKDTPQGPQKLLYELELRARGKGGQQGSAMLTKDEKTIILAQIGRAIPDTAKREAAIAAWTNFFDEREEYIDSLGEGENAWWKPHTWGRDTKAEELANMETARKGLSSHYSAPTPAATPVNPAATPVGQGQGSMATPQSRNRIRP